MPKQNRSKNAAKKPSASKSSTPWLWIAGGGVLLVAILLFAFTRRNAGAPLTEISAAEAYQKYQQDVFFLDVRTLDEWNDGHLSKSTSIPLDELASRVNEVPRDQEVVVICRSGNRSKEAMRILLDAGFTQVVGLEGGLKAWSAAGYAVE